jgi:protease I
MRALEDRRIAVLVADGFEQVEFTVPVTALRIAGASVDVISLRRGKIRGVNLHEPGSRVRVNKTVTEAQPSEYDGLFLPGGFINPDLLRQSSQARAFVRAFDASGKAIVSLCHGPWVLASAGILHGRTMTSWPGIRDDMVNAGAVWLDQPVVADGNLLTSRGPQDLVPFVEAMVDLFSQPGSIRTPRLRAATSSPQREAPPEIVLSAMKWVPRPSLRAAVGLGALALGFAIVSSRELDPENPRIGGDSWGGRNLNRPT